MDLGHVVTLAELTPEQVIARVFLDIAIVVAVARVMGALFKRIHQPAADGCVIFNYQNAFVAHSIAAMDSS